MNQKTIKKSFILEGVAVHSGVFTTVTCHPAPPNTGIIFLRTDVFPPEEIHANANFVSDTTRCTQLTNEKGYSASMVEHILSAFRGMDIDNVHININQPELPILDGSSHIIARKIFDVGYEDQKVKRNIVRLQKKVRVKHGQSFLEATPSFATSYSITFKNENEISYLTDQTTIFDPSTDDYLTHISLARTFCFEKELNYLRSQGLIQGASLETGIVVGDKEIYPNTRFSDELSRHKLLDIVGDLALIPHVNVDIRGEGTSHYLNTLLAKEILNNSIC